MNWGTRVGRNFGECFGKYKYSSYGWIRLEPADI